MILLRIGLLGILVGIFGTACDGLEPAPASRPPVVVPAPSEVTQRDLDEAQREAEREIEAAKKVFVKPVGGVTCLSSAAGIPSRSPSIPESSPRMIQFFGDGVETTPFDQDGDGTIDSLEESEEPDTLSEWNDCTVDGGSYDPITDRCHL